MTPRKALQSRRLRKRAGDYKKRLVKDNSVNWPISDCIGLSFWPNYHVAAAKVDRVTGNSFRLQQNAKTTVTMAAVKEQVLNWLYSVLTSVSQLRYIRWETVANWLRNIKT
jgi:hypothetical protein